LVGAKPCNGFRGQRKKNQKQRRWNVQGEKANQAIKPKRKIAGGRSHAGRGKNFRAEILVVNARGSEKSPGTARE